MGNLLFNPNGRIGKGPFWQGVIILIVAGIVLSVVTAYLPIGISMLISFLSIGLVYPYLCVYGKRLHDAGMTAWIFLAFLVGALIVSWIVSMVLTPILAPGAAQIQEDMMQVGDPSEVFAMTSELTRALLPASIVSSVISNLVIGFIGASLKSDPNANKHGPPTSPDAAAATFE